MAKLLPASPRGEGCEVKVTVRAMEGGSVREGPGGKGSKMAGVRDQRPSRGTCLFGVRYREKRFGRSCHIEGDFGTEVDK